MVSKQMLFHYSCCNLPDGGHTGHSGLSTLTLTSQLSLFTTHCVTRILTNSTAPAWILMDPNTPGPAHAFHFAGCSYQPDRRKHPVCEVQPMAQCYLLVNEKDGKGRKKQSIWMTTLVQISATNFKNHRALLYHLTDPFFDEHPILLLVGKRRHKLLRGV